MGRILAIDVGRKRVGLAVTDELQIIANPLTTVHAQNAISYIVDYCNKETVDCFVVGDPRHMNNKASESIVYINSFVKQLKKKLPLIPVEFEDERFTSKMAKQSIIDAGAKKKDRQNKELVDMVSATIILQSYLEKR